MENKFIKCFSKQGYEYFKDKQLEFLFNENGVYWFQFNGVADFSDSELEYEITNIINM